jgi:glycosyltransferase involved in cell wall biosynthesis
VALRVAIVHDYLVQYGGAERVVEALHELWPDAPVYTSLYAPDAMPASFAAMDVRTSFLQHVPAVRRRFKLALPLYPAAMRSLDLSGYELVVSSSSGWAHGVRTDAGARHVVYCHTPARWLYRTDSYVRNERWAATPILPLLRHWDRRSAARPTDYLANSQAVRERIARVYGRPARVVYPPVDTRRFAVAEADDYYLCVSRLNPYKRIELAVQACERLGRRLLVAGDGPARRELRRLAGARTELLGRVSDSEIAELLARCRALIVPAEEDFCITAVEAMASGRPVVGFGRGGLVETVVPERTGVLFTEGTVESLARALLRLERLELDPAAIRRHALRFDVRRFGAELREIVEPTALAAA